MKDPYAGITPKIVILAEAQNWRCCYCGIPMTRDRGAHDEATTEHVVPLIAGGERSWDNEIAACRLCNEGRGAMFARKYFQMVQWKGREKAARWGHRRYATARKNRSQSNGLAIRSVFTAPQFGLLAPLDTTP